MEEPKLTPKELRELLIDVRQTKEAVSVLGEQIKEMHLIVAGNGRYSDSLVGRMQLMEERQKVGAAAQNEVAEELAELRECVEKHNKLLEKDHDRIGRIETDQTKIAADHEKLEEKQGGLEKTIDAFRNKAIGIGIGAGVGTGGGLFLVSELIAKISGSIP